MNSEQQPEPVLAALLANGCYFEPYGHTMSIPVGWATLTPLPSTAGAWPPGTVEGLAWYSPWPEANQHAHCQPYTSIEMDYGRDLVLLVAGVRVAALVPWQEAGYGEPGFLESYARWQAHLAQPGEVARLRHWLLHDSFGIPYQA